MNTQQEFDPEYYRAKYFMYNFKSDDEAYNHWIRRGKKKGYIGSVCQELKNHDHDLCVCKNKKISGQSNLKNVKIEIKPNRTNSHNINHILAKEQETKINLLAIPNIVEPTTCISNIANKPEIRKELYGLFRTMDAPNNELLFEYNMQIISNNIREAEAIIPHIELYLNNIVEYIKKCIEAIVKISPPTTPFILYE